MEQKLYCQYTNRTLNTHIQQAYFFIIFEVNFFTMTYLAFAPFCL